MCAAAAIVKSTPSIANKIIEDGIANLALTLGSVESRFNDQTAGEFER
jgi:hypothetical protein